MMSLYFEIRFIDSFKFLQTSLANLVSNLQLDDFHNTKREFKKNVDLLTRKGGYPYVWQILLGFSRDKSTAKKK